MNDDAFLKFEMLDKILKIKLYGEWNFKLPKKVVKSFAKVASLKDVEHLEVDFGGINDLDYAIAIFIKNSLNQSGKKYVFMNLNELDEKIFSSIDKSLNYGSEQNISVKKTGNPFFKIGESIFENLYEARGILNFLGECLIKFCVSLFKPSNLRIKEILAYFQDAGIKSVFIVCLTSFLIGIVLAYQGHNLLSNFGASVVIIEMMGILTLREIAPLIAAIIVAGRLASSFTAQIGTMKITEEIDAMKTMGFDPFKFLVLPRIIALIAAMPLIVFLADVAGVIGEMTVVNSHLDIGFQSYLDRFNREVDIRHLYVGLIKAPFFGAVIAFIGCLRGFEITGDTQSVGRYTTVSVVNAIFCVIAVDALFSIIFTKVGI